jgi:serine/threonine-protein phosphatase 2A regulatory subunit B'
MVYNAMKLFMEINPQLFDECSQEYNEHQNGAEEREKARRRRWELLTEQADKRKKGLISDPPSLASTSAAKSDDIDPVTQDSQKRLNALKLDESTIKERSSNSVS